MAEAMELKTLRRTHAASKIWVNQSRTLISKLLEEPTAELLSIESAIRGAEQRLSQFDAVQWQLEVAVPEEEMGQCIVDADEFRNSLLSVIIAAQKQIAPTPDKLDNVSTSGSRSSNVKLPQLQLPTFDGAVVNWQPFWDKFRALIHETDLPEVTKFSYLSSVLEKDAKQVVQGLAVTEANYSIAIQLLQDRFGRKERIIFAHIQSLLSLQPLASSLKGSARIAALWTLQDTVLSHTRSLETFGIEGDTFGVFLTPIILSWLPADIRLEWAREGEGKEDNLAFLLTFLSKEIRRRERSDTFKDTVQLSTNAQEISSNKNGPSKGSVTALHVSSSTTKVTCVFFKKNHSHEKCPVFSSRFQRRHKLTL